MGLEQGVQPGRAGAFFEGYVQGAQTVNKLQYGFRFCFKDGFHHQLAIGIQDRGRDGCLVNIEPNII